MFIDGETLPLDEDIKQGHGRGQAHGEVALGAMARVLGMADLREHGGGHGLLLSSGVLTPSESRVSHVLVNLHHRVRVRDSHS